jgi:hypothetical protein
MSGLKAGPPKPKSLQQHVTTAPRNNASQQQVTTTSNDKTAAGEKFGPKNKNPTARVVLAVGI